MSNETVLSLKPGEQTSEFKLATNASLWGKIALILGIVMSVGNEVLDAVRALPGLEQSHALTYVGGALSIIGIIYKTVTGKAYIDGRSDIKASAAQPTIQLPASIGGTQTKDAA